MESTNITITEEWIRKKLNITHDNLEDVKSLSLAGTYQEKITHLGSALQKFTRLKEIDLSRNALVSLDGLENCKHLEKINLYYNNIFSLKEVERLKHNTMLNELDLRLNPITKEENDYRLYLIQLLPSLKMCDDRAIRDSERQMAIAYFDQANQQQAAAQQQQQQQQGHYDQQYQSGCGSLSRVKSVSNIAKRSAGINECDEYQRPQENGGYNLTNRCYEETDQQQGSGYTDSNSNSFYRSKSMQNLRADCPNGSGSLQRQKSVHFNDVASYQEINGRSSSDQNLNAGDEADTYANFKPRGSFTPNPLYDQQDEELQYNKIADAEKLGKNPEEFKSTLFLLLDLVDRYWNGSKSLHQNYKFLGLANQLLKQYNPSSTAASVSPDQPDHTLLVKLNKLQDENKKLQAQLNSRSGEATSSELQYKNYQQEIDILKKKLSMSLEENKRMHKEFTENSEKAHKEYTLDSMETHNGSLKRDNEIMKIKLKQYEQLQSLTAMLQESHKSLVTTNDHLLQEINNCKRDLVKSSHVSSRYVSNSLDADLYSPTVSTHETSYGSPANPKAQLRKQYEQLNNSLTNRYGYQKC